MKRTGRAVGLSDLHDAAVIIRRRTFLGNTRHASRGTTHRVRVLLPPAARPRPTSLAPTRSTDPGEKRRPPTTLARENKCVSDPAVGYMPGEGIHPWYTYNDRPGNSLPPIATSRAQIPILERPPADPPETVRDFLFRECETDRPSRKRCFLR